MNARRLHKQTCSCEVCTYTRARLTPPVPTVREVELAGPSIALDQIAEIVSRAPDDWSGSREDARRAAGGTLAVGECDHWNARNVWICADCGEDWEEQW